MLSSCLEESLFFVFHLQNKVSEVWQFPVVNGLNCLYDTLDMVSFENIMLNEESQFSFEWFFYELYADQISL